jgi:hypothetical protein
MYRDSREKSRLVDLRTMMVKEAVEAEAGAEVEAAIMPSKTNKKQNRLLF